MQPDMNVLLNDVIVQDIFKYRSRPVLIHISISKDMHDSVSKNRFLHVLYTENIGLLKH